MEAEQQNITYRRLGVHVSRWFKKIVTNAADQMEQGTFFAWSDDPGMNTDKQLKSIAPIAVSLANNFHAQRRTVNLEALRGLLGLIDNGDLPAFVQDHFRQARDTGDPTPQPDGPL